MTNVAALALLSPELSPDGPRPPPPVRANMVHFDTIIDYILTHPGATNREIAAHIRRGEPWVSLVMRSDAFAEHYKARRAVLNVSILDGVQSRLAAVTERAAAHIIKKFDDNPHGVTIDQSTTILDKATARLGFGQPAAAAPVSVNIGSASQQTVFIASPEAIARARDRLRAAQSGMPGVAPAEIPQVSGGAAMSVTPGTGAMGSALPPIAPRIEPDVEDLVEVDEDFDVSVRVGRDA